ncbi:hypothetical protein KAFR_0H02290 [Kazachstania africana CBS 2517]|uniref:Glutamine amidotransferase domain-containing protein n=1 Tax=Kazachstania africana (strain ATCC 22294 / BCRC 22015 / CBS 2517 / CECT 1963 / NBRC 1671 / NRRL Y-8276) TaxID=1071382 RepID=H2AZ82_KAZAF|nr:hypothetical protein KAFR_0H02290 [Kazachstania africana CBS 2517]CCF59638.1 hypothetical protein KAFR_0H02290 [Kazachstania africana CBS 2517]
MTKKIAIFKTDDDEDWTKPYGNFADMAINVMNQCKPFDVEYRVFDVVNNDFPKFTELLTGGYVGIYVTGSKYDSFDESTEWIVKLRKHLRHMIVENRGKFPPVVGVCFGHQIISYVLGAEVNRNPEGFEGGIVSIALNEYGTALFENKESLNLSELHNDIVFDVPTDVVNWGASAKCPVQGFYRPNELLTFQGHPEFVNEVARNGYNLFYAKPDHNSITTEEYKSMETSITTKTNDGLIAAKAIWKLYETTI